MPHKVIDQVHALARCNGSSLGTGLEFTHRDGNPLVSTDNDESDKSGPSDDEYDDHGKISSLHKSVSKCTIAFFGNS